MNSEAWVLTFSMIAVAIVALTAIMQHKPLTLESGSEILAASKPLAQEIREVAEEAVRAAQQLKESEHISNDAAYQLAANHVAHWAELIGIQLNEATIRTTVEAAYYGLKLVMRQVDKPPVVVLPTPPDASSTTSYQGAGPSQPG